MTTLSQAEMKRREEHVHNWLCDDPDIFLQVTLDGDAERKSGHLDEHRWLAEAHARIRELESALREQTERAEKLEDGIRCVKLAFQAGILEKRQPDWACFDCVENPVPPKNRPEPWYCAIHSAARLLEDWPMPVDHTARQLSLFRRSPRFNGASYDPKLDHDRLEGQHERIRDLMLDGTWRTLAEIAGEANCPEASASAQLRHLRKKRFGAWLVEKRRRGPASGLWEYRVSEGT